MGLASPVRAAAAGTGRTHLSRAMTRLGVRDPAQLIVLAYETGLVRPKWLT
jgi:DNA-binding NarL/FixJ family response regulator